MKVTKTVQLNICDICKTEECHYQCNGCKMDICYECQETHSVRYNVGVYHGGSGDAIYCRPCDVKLQSDKLHLAYQKIKDLRNESDVFYKSFEIRKIDAEGILKELQT